MNYLDLALVAGGDPNFYFREGYAYWDFAAGIPLITEAGGRCTDLNGNALTPQSKNALLRNGTKHKELLQLLNGRLCL